MSIEIILFIVLMILTLLVIGYVIHSSNSIHNRMEELGLNDSVQILKY